MKKNVCLLAAFLVIFVAASVSSATSAQNGMRAYDGRLLTASGELGGKLPLGGSSRYCGNELCFSLDRHSGTEDTGEIFRISYNSFSSGMDRRMIKEAAVALRAMPLNIWKSYMSDYLNSVTEGGKKGIKVSANLSGELRDALCPELFYS
jgi:hypothetical protein